MQYQDERERLKERQRDENDVLAWNTWPINGAEHVVHSSMDLCTMTLIMPAILEGKSVRLVQCSGALAFIDSSDST